MGITTDVGKLEEAVNDRVSFLEGCDLGINCDMIRDGFNAIREIYNGDLKRFLDRNHQTLDLVSYNPKYKLYETDSIKFRIIPVLEVVYLSLKFADANEKNDEERLNFLFPEVNRWLSIYYKGKLKKRILNPFSRSEHVEKNRAVDKICREFHKERELYQAKN